MARSPNELVILQDRRILKLLAKGLTAPAIAHRLKLSVRNVRYRIAMMRERYQVLRDRRN